MIPTLDRKSSPATRRQRQLAAVACCLLLPLGWAQSDDSGQCDASGPRKDCGYNGITPDKCHYRKCCYSPAAGTIGGAGAPESLPPCFYPNSGASNYEMTSNFAPSDAGLMGALKLAVGTQPELGPDIQNLNVTVENVSPNILRVKIGADGRWEVPRSIFKSSLSSSSGAANYNFNFSTSPFTFAVTRTGSGDVVFNMAGQRLVFKDQYLEVSTAVPETAALYGLGERTPSSGLELRRDGLPLTLWNRDSPAGLPEQNIYGSHPILIDHRADGKAHGLLLLNSNGMDVVLTKNKVRWSVTGGVLDFYFLMGPTPNAVMEQLTSIIGRPVMPPYWSLGLMNSKYGYGSAEFYTQITRGYANASIPLETFVSDSQYMDHDQDFTLGGTFPLADMEKFVNSLHANGQHWVPILDPCIHIAKSYPVYQSGVTEDVFIKDLTGRPYVGQLWPGATHWPDFKNPKARDWWGGQIKSVYTDLPLDGIWLDMNEVSNYCSGDVCHDSGNVVARNDFHCDLYCEYGPTAGGGPGPGATPVPVGYFDPPYRINNGNQQLNISFKTLPVSAAHFDGSLEYNMHNLYSIYETMATADALQSLRGRRQFILTRSTFLGSGSYAAHWTGDTNSEWGDLRWSIPDILNAGMAGISFAGADICGFMKYATSELCARWIAAGAWYPYARDHHADGFQELFRWSDVAEVSRKVLGWRYRALPYLYTAFFDSHTFGCPVARPLFFVFSQDSGVRNIADQWMMGDALMVSPILDASTSTRSAYFPPGTWYDLYDGTAIDTTGGGKLVTLTAGVTDNVPLHVLGGNILPLSGGGMTTAAVRNSSLTLLVAFPKANGSAPAADRCGGGCGGAGLAACGHMYLDGGEDLAIGNALDNFLTMTAHMTLQDGMYQGTLDVQFTGPQGGGNGACSANVAWPVLDSIKLLGVGAVNTQALSLLEVGGAPPEGQVQTASVANTLPLGAVAYSGANATLTLAGLGYQLRCPSSVHLQWTSAPPST